MNSKGRHRNKGIVTEASCASCRKTEPSERLRTQPSILHYKGAALPDFTHSVGTHCVGTLAIGSSTSSPVSIGSCLKNGSSRAPLANLVSAFPAFTYPGRARTLENHRETRQPKPNPREPRPRRVPVKKSTAVPPSDCPRDSGWPTNSSALPKRTRDIDWRCSQSHCNPGTDTH